MARARALVEFNWLKGGSFVSHKGLLDYSIPSQLRWLRRPMEVMQMLKESIFGFVKLLVARTIPVVVVCMFDMYSAIPSSTKMAVMSFDGGKVLTEWWTSVLSNDIVKAP